MEQKLHDRLMENETLLWSGRPEEFVFMDSTHKVGYLVKWISVLVVCVGALGWYLNYCAKTNTAVLPTVVLCALAIILYGCLSDFMDANKLQKKTMYALSDQRILLLLGDKLHGVEYHNVEEYTFTTDADGHTSLLCGPRPLTEKQNKRRMGTARGICYDHKTGACETLVMYGLKDEDQNLVNKILAEKIIAE